MPVKNRGDDHVQVSDGEGGRGNGALTAPTSKAVKGGCGGLAVTTSKLVKEKSSSMTMSAAVKVAVTYVCRNYVDGITMHAAAVDVVVKFSPSQLPVYPLLDDRLLIVTTYPKPRHLLREDYNPSSTSPLLLPMLSLDILCFHGHSVCLVWIIILAVAVFDM
ncbi:hypothetical protein GALMADRAFT_142501 [Galerina marginata CBS 339.88]|uniref:Uncharacterized protein n=1 Tax=Galerina marginata (strain CBS 339.88) TaxID=685588 RepID=A0A067SR30_GALM3|nr:hypothetical protein GALMADRAFT_142501 [Galerina marginata CBS 339.88]